MLWSGDPSLSSLSEPLVLGSEDSRIAGVTPALGWGVCQELDGSRLLGVSKTVML